MQVRAKIFVTAATFVLPFLAVPAHAVQILNVSGTISTLSVAASTQNVNDTGQVDVQLSVALPGTSCPSSPSAPTLLEFDSTSVPDAQTRNNMLAILLAAKLAGSTIAIAYDGSATATCSPGGFPIPMYIFLK
jgi:hypothetical protein